MKIDVHSWQQLECLSISGNSNSQVSCMQLVIDLKSTISAVFSIDALCSECMTESRNIGEHGAVISTTQTASMHAKSYSK